METVHDEWYHLEFLPALLTMWKKKIIIYLNEKNITLNIFEN